MERRPAVTPLCLHLPDEQQVVVDDMAPSHAVNKGQLPPAKNLIY